MSVPDLFQRLRHGPPRGLSGVVFWTAVWFCLFWLLRFVPGAVGELAGVLQILSGIALFVLAVPVVWRQVRRRMLWSLRNKLVLTYLLIGLAPIVLFVTLVLIFSYIAAGQFAIHLADSRVQSELDWLSSENANLEDRLMQPISKTASAAGSISEAKPDEDSAYRQLARRSNLHPEVTAFVDGVPLTVDRNPNRQKTPLGLPPWASKLSQEGYRGMALDGNDLYLVSIHQHALADGRRLSIVSSLPMDQRLMSTIANGLGEAAMIAPIGQSPAGAAAIPAASETASNRSSASRSRVSREELSNSSVFGGTEPPPVNVADLRVRFLSTLPVTDWYTGAPGTYPIQVVSRPSLLYRQLFGNTLNGDVTSVIRISLFVLCILFAIIEILALIMAARLSRTVTASIADLYNATRRIDRGDFDHRIPVERDDQLAELGRSFNNMTGSLQRLLVEQKEKERLQSEISIAQEVQANLFPHQAFDLPGLDLHGICRPARSVSGDYYDFLTFHKEAHDGHPDLSITGVGLAIGDISGKGISAALLMATLHSAVRAYRFASEELVYAESSVAGLMSSRDQTGDCGELFESPGKILALLNRHLYRSTQPEKYATLFLAHYDAGSARLTYSNAGQLPPLVLGADGAVRRLDRGGTVVGLIDGMKYEEDSFTMVPGDILVAYSDGVTEPENDFGDFGEERLVEVVQRYRHEPLHIISEQVMQALDAWIGAEEQPDDITLVLARQA